ncbi:hypothetical protein FXN61_48890, partial [Lentzea sp. PSKA42]|nr:hypothetical protein [Lentzea indica]
MAQRAQHLPALGAAHSTRSVVVRHLGRLDAAARDARTGVDLLTRCGAATDGAVLAQADVLIELGDHAECAELLVQLPESWVARLASGRLRAATGMAGSAVDDLLECGKLVAHQDIGNPAVAPWRSEVALVLHSTGRSADALALARDE